MSKAMTLLKAMSKMTGDELRQYCEENDILHIGYTSNLFGYPMMTVPSIFGGGSGTGSTTSNGGRLTWIIPNANNSNQSTPTVKVALYRRSTHDEKGNYKQFTPTQEQLWKDLAVVATMTNALAWKSVDEIFRDATDYRNRMIGGKKEYISRDFVEQSLEILCNNGLIEKNDA